MSIRTVITVALALTLSPLTAVAQEGGSIYSLLGVGDIRYFPNARSAGMGNTGIGLYSTSSVNIMAPGTWTRVERVRMEANALLEGFNTTNGTTSRYLSSMGFEGAVLALPLMPQQGVTLVLGMTPYSNMNFDVYVPQSFAGLDTVDYRLHYVGTGGLGRAQLGLSFAPIPDLSFGASFDFLFGSLEKTLTLEPRSGRFAAGTGIEFLQVYGPSVTVGGLFSGFGGLLGFLEPLSVGFYGSARTTLNTERYFEFQYLTDRDTSSSTRGTMAIPLAYGFGVSYQAGPLVTIAADLSGQLWGDMEINGVTPVGIRDSYRAGIGIEYSGSRAFGASWGARMGFRAGAFYEATYYQVNGTPIDELGGSIGFTLPVYSDISSETRATFAFQYSRRGTLENNLARDYIFRMMVSLNIGQIWFVGYQED